MHRKTWRTGWVLALALGAWAAGLACSAPAAPPPEVDGEMVLTLEGAVMGGKPLTVYLDCREEKVAGAFAVARTFNKAPHTVDASALHLRPGRMAGVVGVTLNPDFWVPKHGKPVGAMYTLNARIEDGRVAGTFKGACFGKTVSGPVEGRLSPHPPADAYARLRCFLPQMLIRHKTYRGGEYKRDADLTFAIRDGRAVGGMLEPIVPDYVAYTAEVEGIDLEPEGSALRGTVGARIFYTSPKSNAGVREEPCTLRIDGRLIGDAVAGTYDVELKGRAERGKRFLGEVERGGPPKPSESLLRATLHGAMTGGKPVNLLVSLAPGGPSHGFAYAPMHNHQPHAVEGRDLEVSAGAIEGGLAISFRRDAYWHHDPFTNIYRVDVRIEAGMVTGTYRGADRSEKVKGRIAGELLAAGLPAATMKTLRTCELGLGYALRGGKRAAHNHARVRLHYRDGKFQRGEVLNPGAPQAFEGDVEKADLRIDGDRLRGSVELTIRSEVLEAGRYRFAVDAIVIGDRLRGWWRAWHEGKEYYTKSAKLGGRVTAAE